MLLKIAFRVALAAGIVYATKKVLDRTGVTEKLVAIGQDIVDKVEEKLTDGLLMFTDESDADEGDAMTTPQAAQWASREMADTGGAGGSWNK